ncbi:transposase [Solirubrobacter ginsenosidimutans]|uniref:transposase n=1 Tax=Solirubrobacter ginsenosidimutans TaxID=490573 RepID=UPI003557075C
MDLEAFYGAYRADGRSRPAFDPAMMVALILYAYPRGNRSSRAIERACVRTSRSRLTRLRHPRTDHRRGPQRTHGGRCHCAPARGCRGLGLLTHPADPASHRRRHFGPDQARVRAANRPQAGLARRDL